MTKYNLKFNTFFNRIFNVWQLDFSRHCHIRPILLIWHFAGYSKIVVFITKIRLIINTFCNCSNWFKRTLFVSVFNQLTEPNKNWIWYDIHKYNKLYSASINKKSFFFTPFIFKGNPSGWPRMSRHRLPVVGLMAMGRDHGRLWGRTPFIIRPKQIGRGVWL